MRRTLAILGLVVILASAWSMTAAEEAEQASQPAPAKPALPEDMITLGKLATVYEPAYFMHSTHSTYMDCASCHHHHNDAAILACSTCHSPSAKLDAEFSVPVQGKCATCHKGEAIRGPLTISSLKEAYHKQCFTCHTKEMGQEPYSCTGCHSKKAPQ